MIDPTGDDKTLREPGTKELIKLTKAGLNTKLNANDANISNGTITIKGTSITPISSNDVNITDGTITIKGTSITPLTSDDVSLEDGTITIGEESITPLTSDDVSIDTDTNTITVGEDSITVPDEYELPIADDDTLGGIKVGNGLSIDANGVLSTDGGYTLPIASDTTLGGIKVGDNLTIDSTTGVLSADAQSITVDDELDDESENPVQNKVLTPILEGLNTRITAISRQTVDLWWGMNDAPYIVTGNAFIYLDGIVDDDIPIVDNAEIVTE